MNVLDKIKLINQFNLIDDIILLIKQLLPIIIDLSLDENFLVLCHQNNLLKNIRCISPPTIEEFLNHSMQYSDNCIYYYIKNDIKFERENYHNYRLPFMSYTYLDDNHLIYYLTFGPNDYNGFRMTLKVINKPNFDQLIYPSFVFINNKCDKIIPLFYKKFTMINNKS